MAADPLAHLVAGQRLPGIPGASWNLFCDAARESKRSRLGRQGGIPPFDPVYPQTTVVARNDTGAGREPGDIAVLSVSPIDPTQSPLEFRRRPVFAASAPTSVKDRFVIFYDAVGTGGYGRVTTQGRALATTIILNPAHDFAVPIVGDCTQLRSHFDFGSRINYRAGSSGPVLTEIDLSDGSPRIIPFWAKLSGDFALTSDDAWGTIATLTSNADFHRYTSHILNIDVSGRVEMKFGAGKIMARLFDIDAGAPIDGTETIVCYTDGSPTNLFPSVAAGGADPGGWTFTGEIKIDSDNGDVWQSSDGMAGTLVKSSVRPAAEGTGSISYYFDVSASNRQLRLEAARIGLGGSYNDAFVRGTSDGNSRVLVHTVGRLRA